MTASATNSGYLQEILQQVNELNADSSLQVNDVVVRRIYSEAESIAREVTSSSGKPQIDWDKTLDDILTSRVFGFPSMLLLLVVVFWITLAGANYPSEILASVLFQLQEHLSNLLVWLNAPAWLTGFAVEGVYCTVAWVVSVMLPPMAIFFPLFTILEDIGYLPRIAFNLDRFFKMACACGKQALTMCMGFGCNAAGVVSCRIIDSPRERLLAMLTNNFVPCNGRFPTLIALASLLVMGTSAWLGASLFVVGIVLFGILVTLGVSWLLSKTLLKGVPSSFTLELPPYRKPQVGKIIIRSLFDRTLFVLGRAVCVAAPAGAITWILANTQVAGSSLLTHTANFLAPWGHLLGMDGFILMAFILGLPANEIVLPILIMSYTATGTMTELDSLQALHQLLFTEQGWTWLTVLSVMLFSLLHYPCGTTLWTMWKESGSIKWTVLGALIPLSIACLVCLSLTQSARLLGL